ncbi:MAG: DUF4412 domain-containing protein [Thermoanaerobaculia bacterium]
MKLAISIVLATVLTGCNRAPAVDPSPRPRRDGPTVEAKVLTIRESHHPPTRAFLSPIVVFGSKVRIGTDLDQWRLFDLEAQTVTWVDEIARTYRTVSAADLARRRQRQLRTAVPGGIPLIEGGSTGLEAELEGVAAEQWLMKLGGYEREIWLSKEPLAGSGFLRMWLTSEPISEPYAGVMRNVDGALMRQDGFPVYERTAFTWEGGAMVSRRRLVSIETRQVSASLFEIPSDYLDVSLPGMRSGGGRRSAS